MAKAFGFKLIPVNNLKAVYDHMNAEGTCCLAYGDFVDLHVDMLLEGCRELQELRAKGADDDVIAWCNLDDEIVEALIMLRAMVNIGSETLYWCSICKDVNTKPFKCDCNRSCGDNSNYSFGLDFTTK